MFRMHFLSIAGSKTRFICIQITAIFLLLTSQLNAQAVSWDGGASTSNWNDALNWSTDLVPTSSNDVTINAATVNIPAGYAAMAKSVNVSSASTLQVLATGSLSINLGAPFALSLSTSSLINDGSLTITNCTSAISLAGAGSSIQNNGAISVNNHFGYGLLFASGCTGCIVDNNSTMSFDNGTNDSTPTIFYQTSGFLFNNDGTVDIGLTANAGIGIGLGAMASGGFTNNGTVNIYNTGVGRAGLSVGFLGGAFNNTSTGTLNLGSGIGGAWLGGFNMALTNDGTISINKAGTVNANAYGTGTYSGSQPFDNLNTFSPGNSGSGCLTFIAGYSNVSGSPGPVTNMQLGGTTPCTEHDKINVTGTATLTGTLNVSLISGFTPTAGQSFTILEASSRVGTYTTINYPVVSGISWTTSYTSTSVIANATFSLPVEMTHFKANEKQQGYVELTWQTATEFNNHGFFVERSSDGKVWQNLGFVNGKGTTHEQQDYRFWDEKPLSGMNYYRLRQMDFDGGEEFSKMVTVNLREIGGFKNLVMSPNPTTGIFEVNDDFEPESIIRINDSLGRLVAERKSMEGQIFDLSGFENGVYSVQIFTGNQVAFGLIVKQD